MIWTELSYNKFDEPFESENDEKAKVDLTDINIQYDENEEE